MLSATAFRDSLRARGAAFIKPMSIIAPTVAAARGFCCASCMACCPTPVFIIRSVTPKLGITEVNSPVTGDMSLLKPPAVSTAAPVKKFLAASPYCPCCKLGITLSPYSLPCCVCAVASANASTMFLPRGTVKSPLASAIAVSKSSDLAISLAIASVTQLMLWS